MKDVGMSKGANERISYFQVQTPGFDYYTQSFAVQTLARPIVMSIEAAIQG